VNQIEQIIQRNILRIFSVVFTNTQCDIFNIRRSVFEYSV